MPICPRCGKCLSSEQALTYHLNRKYKCGTWNCVKCGVNFNTKFQLQMHEMQCVGNRETHEYPTTDTLLRVYQTMPVVCVGMDDRQQVDFVSPQCETLLRIKPAVMVGMNFKECIEKFGSNWNYESTDDRRFLYITKRN